MITTDSFFQQGVVHEVCEDYALHGANYVIISDGCSNAGGPRIHTDWGSRLLCKAAEMYLPIIYDDRHTFFKEVYKFGVDLVSEFVNLPIECLTATLGCLIDNDTFFHFLLVGDGFYGVRRRDKTWEIKEVKFLSGGIAKAAAPFYLRYTQNDDEFEKYQVLFGSQWSITRYVGSLEKLEKIEESIQDFRNFFPYVWWSAPTSEYELAFITSDGVSSFYETITTSTSKHNENISPIPVLQVLLDFVNFRPDFLEVQRNWAFKQNKKGTFIKRNWHNADDVAMGVIRHE